MHQATLFQLADCVAGVDEAGRGPLAGPVVAAAVILDPARPIEGLADSKTLSARRRESLAAEIKSRALAWSVAAADVHEIDRLNILGATLLAMQRAVLGLVVKPAAMLVDGNQLPVVEIDGQRLPGEAIVSGDVQIPSISAASIIAKTARDAIMVKMDEQFPDYAFAQHKGYGTRLHLERLQKHGPCIQHRRSFAPVRRAG